MQYSYSSRKRTKRGKKRKKVTTFVF